MSQGEFLVEGGTFSWQQSTPGGLDGIQQFDGFEQTRHGDVGDAAGRFRTRQ